jgi:hypothetical protein
MAIATKHLGEVLDKVTITAPDPGPEDIVEVEFEASAELGMVSVWVYRNVDSKRRRIPDHAWFDGADLVGLGAALIELGLGR